MHTKHSIKVALPFLLASSEKCFKLILKENSFQFNGKHYLQTHGTAMGTKMAVAFANIFMNAIEAELSRLSSYKPLVWKRYIDDIFSLWNVDKKDIDSFIELANNHHPTIKFTAEISDTEITFLDTCIHKGYRFGRESILDVRTHFKPTESFQYTEYSSCHPPGIRKGFLKGEALRLLRTLQGKLLKRTFNNSKENYKRGVTQITSRRRFFRKLNLVKDRWCYKINKRRTKGFYRL